MIKNTFHNLCKNIKNRIVLGKKNFNECKELIKDLKESLNMNNVKFDVIDKDNVVISAKKSLTEFPNLSVKMDFKNNKIVQEENQKRLIITPFLPHLKVHTITTSTIDGIVKTDKEIQTRSDKMGNYIETTVFKNIMTGNTYKRVKTPTQTEYFKNIGGEYKNLFPKTSI